MSKKCAEKAVYNTAVSRMAMSGIALSIPTFMMMGLRNVGLMPSAKIPKLILELSCVGTGLYFGLPLSVATFPNKQIALGKDLEPEFAKYDNVYYSRGQ